MLAQSTCIGQRHTLVAGDTCPSVAAEYNMTVAQLKALNPALRDCAYLSQLLTLCIGAWPIGLQPALEVKSVMLYDLRLFALPPIRRLQSEQS